MLGEKIYCNPCADKLYQAISKPHIHYNRALRVISGIFGVWFVLVTWGGILYYAEFGLAGELIVDMITAIVAIAYILMALVSKWVSTKLKIKLENGWIFGLIITILFIVAYVATALGPVPPGGW